jgi:hypothetical protein
LLFSAARCFAAASVGPPGMPTRRKAPFLPALAASVCLIRIGTVVPIFTPGSTVTMSSWPLLPSLPATANRCPWTDRTPSGVLMLRSPAEGPRPRGASGTCSVATSERGGRSVLQRFGFFG